MLAGSRRVGRPDDAVRPSLLTVPLGTRRSTEEMGGGRGLCRGRHLRGRSGGSPVDGSLGQVARPSRCGELDISQVAAGDGGARLFDLGCGRPGDAA